MNARLLFVTDSGDAFGNVISSKREGWMARNQTEALAKGPTSAGSNTKAPQ
jgi:hypothetical protein